MAESRFKVGMTGTVDGRPCVVYYVAGCFASVEFSDTEDVDSKYRACVTWADFKLGSPVTDAPAAAPAEQAKEKPQWGDRDGWRYLPLPSEDPYVKHRREYEGPVMSRLVEEWAQHPVNLNARQRTIAALAAEHTRSAESAGLLHPRDYWSCKLRGGRRRG